MNIVVKDQEGNKIEMPLNMRIGNEGVSYFKEHMPIYYPDDPDQMMYFIFKLHSDSDSIIVYLKLDDDIMVSINKRDLYMVYAKAGTRPTSSDYDFKTIIQATDFEEIGFKVFVPGGIMTKGDINIALKAIEGKLFISLIYIVHSGIFPKCEEEIRNGRKHAFTCTSNRYQ